MVFDLTSGIYWRPGEAGGLLWGMSNPDEPPGVAADFDEIYYQKARDRIEELLPGVKGLGLRRTWAATIDYTPDHLPILGPLLTDDGPVEGTVVASPAGHGMMWGPAVAEVAADLTTTGRVRLARSHRPRPRPLRRRRQQSSCPRTHFTAVPREGRTVNREPRSWLQAADAELEDWGPLAEATDHPMATHGTELWVDGDASAGSGSARRVLRGGSWRPTRSSIWSRAG